jgi:transcriptional regulator with XRE-family HTH domain
MGKLSVVRWPQKRRLNSLIVYGRQAPRRSLPAGQLVRAIRATLEMSQRQLARRTGLPQAHIARLERGACDMTIGTLERLLDALSCDLVLVPRARRHFGDLRYEQAEYRFEFRGQKYARFDHPEPKMWRR